MASTTVSDFVIWAKHIQGDPDLAERVLALRRHHRVRPCPQSHRAVLVEPSLQMPKPESLKQQLLE